ncbi:MAG: LysE family transporter [Ignisphaera sp.]
MDVTTLVFTTIAVSSSGALSPGPLTVATLAIGSKYGWKGGGYIALGHMMFELLYIFTLYFFISYIRDLLEGFVGDVVTIVGAGMVIFFAIMLLKDSFRKLRTIRYHTSIDGNVDSKWIKLSKSPILIGVIFTGLNIWFLLWWLSIGFGLLMYVSDMGLTAIGIMYLSHVWIDFAWLILVAETSKRGTQLVGARGYYLFMVFLGTLLLVFGLNIALKRFALVSLLP